MLRFVISLDHFKSSGTVETGYISGREGVYREPSFFGFNFLVTTFVLKSVVYLAILHPGNMLDFVQLVIRNLRKASDLIISKSLFGGVVNLDIVFS
jgi:hypothetical protein